MTDSLFANYVPGQSPVRDHTETPQVITQGEVSPQALERIRKAEKGELKAKLAAVLDRGIVEDRLRVELPDDLHGEWVRNDPLEIRRLQTLGFEVDKTYAVNRAIHSDGSDSSIIGDVIFMTCPREVKEIIDEIRHEQIIKTHMKKKHKKSDVNKEELDYIANVDSVHEEGVKGFSNSEERVATKNDLEDILGTLDAQVKST